MSNYKRILFTGSTGRFGKIFKKLNNKKKFIYPSKKELNVESIQSITKYFKKFKPDLVVHSAALSRPMEIHDKKPSESIGTNIIGTSNLVRNCIKKIK